MANHRRKSYRELHKLYHYKKCGFCPTNQRWQDRGDTNHWMPECVMCFFCYLYIHRAQSRGIRWMRQRQAQVGAWNRRLRTGLAA